MQLNSICKMVRRAQASVEFALVMVVGALVLFAGTQLTLLGAAYLALGQLDDQAVRYAAIHYDCSLSSCSTSGETTIQSYILTVASPLLLGSNNGSSMNITISPSGKRTPGQTVTISNTFTIPSTLIFLPNPFMGIHFPTAFTDTRSAYSEGS
jgi:hypothetical protein